MDNLEAFPPKLVRDTPGSVASSNAFMGLPELTSTTWVVFGEGQIRA